MKAEELGLLLNSSGLGAGIAGLIVGVWEKDYFVIYISFFCFISSLVSIKRYFDSKA